LKSETSKLVDSALVEDYEDQFMWFRSICSIVFVSALSCYRPGSSTCHQDEVAPVRLSGRTFDANTKKPLANVHVFVELCGRYTFNPNPGKGHPNYRYGSVSDDNGNWSLMFPAGPAGLHTFLAGYRYGTVEVLDVGSAGEVPVPMAPLLAADKVPTITNLSASATKAKPGEAISFSVTAKAAINEDPLSEEVLLLQPDTNAARAFNPPLRGEQAVGFANGTWKTVLAAPAKPGTYTYYASVSTEQCITANERPSVKITVE
jgi:hypothetical protein